MKSNHHKLGEFIEQLSRPNSDLLYGIEDVCGITNTKQLIQGTKANLIGRTFEKFSILRPKEFIFNRRTSRNGERISLGYNQTNREWILTEDYCHFRIRKDKADILDSDYLYLLFLRPEFDRYARYNSWGSATEFFNWEEMIEVPIDLIPIEEQRKIVRQYKVITERVELLIKKKSLLDSLLDTIYKNIFIDNIKDGWHEGTLGELIDVRYGKDHKDLSSGMIPLYGSGGIMRHVNKALYDGETVLIPRKGSLNNIVYENGPFWTVDTMFFTTMKSKNLAKYVYLSIRKIDFLHLDTGSAVPSNTSEGIIKTKILIPDADTLDIFERKVTPIFENSKNIDSEINCLKTLSTALLCKIHGE